MRSPGGSVPSAAMRGRRGDPLGVERLPAQRLLGRRRAQRRRRPCSSGRSARPRTTPSVRLDHRGDTATIAQSSARRLNFCVARAPAVERRQADLGEDLALGQRGRQVVLEQVGGGDLALARRRPARPPTPSAASSTAGRSEAGSPWASEPPIVPRWRTCWSAIVAATVAAARGRSSRRRRVRASSRRCGPSPFARSTPLQPGHAAQVDEQRRRGQPQLHQRHERVAAREQLGVLAAVAQRGADAASSESGAT